MPIISPNPVSNPTWDPIVDQDGIEHPRAGFVRWTMAEPIDGVVQVYVDGELRTTTGNGVQSSIWMSLDRDQQREVHLVAVTTDDRWTDFSGTLIVTSRRSVAIVIHRGLGLPWDGLFELTIDGVLQRREPIWSSGDGRAGHGAQFGTGDFGFDSATGPGFGLPDFGSGPFGFDEPPLIWLMAEPTTQGVGQLAALTADGDVVATVGVDLSDWGSVQPSMEIAIDA